MIKYKEFRLGELFQLKAIRQAKSQRAIPTDIKGIPYIVQSQSNNMMARRVQKQYLLDHDEPIISGNKIVLGVTLPAVSYQPEEFGASQVITAEADFLNEINALFFVTLLSKQMVKFSYTNKPGMTKYKKLILKVPVDNQGNINLSYIEKYIAELEQQRLTELDTYLTIWKNTLEQLKN